MDKKFNQIYYSDDGYWRGKSAIQKLSRATGSTKEEAERWLNQMIFIRQTFSIYHMTDTKRKYLGMF